MLSYYNLNWNNILEYVLQKLSIRKQVRHAKNKQDVFNNISWNIITLYFFQLISIRLYLKCTCGLLNSTHTPSFLLWQYELPLMTFSIRHTIDWILKIRQYIFLIADISEINLNENCQYIYDFLILYF